MKHITPRENWALWDSNPEPRDYEAVKTNRESFGKRERFLRTRRRLAPFRHDFRQNRPKSLLRYGA